MSYSEKIFGRWSKSLGRAKPNPVLNDPFIRKGNRTRQFIRHFRTYPFPVRMSLVFLVGFCFGAAIEVFACKTMLYESVTRNKERRRHEFDEFVVQFRHDVDAWQQADMARSQAKA